MRVRASRGKRFSLAACATADMIDCEILRDLPFPNPEVWMPYPSARHCSRVVPAIEPLERRSLLSAATVPLGIAPQDIDLAGPQLVGAQLLGPNRGITGVVLTFNESLDPATAQDVRAFQVLKKIHRENDEDSGGFFDVPFAPAEEGGTTTDIVRIKFDLAVYDDAAKTVTLTPANPFRADKRFRQLRVAGKGERAIKDVAGNSLDGDGNGRGGDNLSQKFKARKGGKLTVKDTDGDRATLRLKGSGRIVSMSHWKTKGPPDPLIFLEETDAARSVFSGTVKKARRGDGVVDIEQVTGISTANVTFLTDPSFRIGLTQG